MSEQDLICFCMSVTRDEITKAVFDGNDTLDKLKLKLQCCTGCGTCEERVMAIVKEVREIKAKNSAA